MATDLIHALERHHTVLPEAIRSILVDLGTTLSNASTEARKVSADSKKLLTWLKSHQVVRPFYFKSAAVLLALAAAINVEDIGVTATSAGIRKKIVSFLERFPDTLAPATDLVEPPIEDPATHYGAENAESAPSLTKAQKLLRLVLQSSYLPRLEGKAKGYASRGLQLEKPLLERVLRHSREGLTPIKVLELGAPPLVVRKNIGVNCVGGSVDAVARAIVPHTGDDSEDSEEEEEELILVEAKARVTASTEQKERRKQGLAALMAMNPRLRRQSAKKYWEINAQSNLFSYFVDDKKEALQILHHAFVYDVRYVLLLMGNDTADIISGIFVKFDEGLKTAWKNVLTDISRLSLDWAYGESAPVFEREFLDPVLESIKLHNKKDGVLDFPSFKQWVLLWHDVRFKKALPLPPIARIIPFVISSWNAFKGGSDTLTKLIWNADYDPPTNDIQAHAVARLLLLTMTVVHRLRHLATAKADLNFYRSLKHYRNAANQRSSFHKTLLSMASCFGGDADGGVSFAASLPPLVPSAIRHRTRNAPVVQNSFGAVTTGVTPQRNSASRMQKLLQTADDQLDDSERRICQRWQTCIGPLVYMVNADGKRGPKGVCHICNTQTSWTCLGCHTNFCAATEAPDESERSRRPKRRKISIPSINGSTTTKTIVARNSCWLHKHIDALEGSVVVDETH
jgi:hypothetical protein